MNKRTHEQRPRVFLSYAKDDSAVVRQVAAALQKTGKDVWLDTWELARGDSIKDRVNLAVHTSDLFLVILSKASVASHWVQSELSAALASEMNDRAISIIPVLVEDCDIPASLADRSYVDLRGDVATGVQQLATQLAVAPAVDLSQLDPEKFEHLVADLLGALGFGVSEARESARDQGYDFLVTRTSRDPTGAEQTDTWVTEVKAYRQQRVSLATIQKLIGFLASTPSDTKGLVITNSRLTSVAREFLSSATLKAGRDVRVIDGTELTNLLLRQPDLVDRYFPSADST
jgi:hypothetical protein